MARAKRADPGGLRYSATPWCAGQPGQPPLEGGNFYDISQSEGSLSAIIESVQKWRRLCADRFQRVMFCSHWFAHWAIIEA